MAGPIYADSFAGLTAGRQADDRLRASQTQAAIGNLLSSMNQARSYKLNDEALTYQKKQDAQLTAERATDRASREKESLRNYLLKVQEGTLDSDKLQLERERVKAFELRPNSAQSREYQLQLESAQADAQEGAFTDEADFASKYPTLPPTVGRAIVDQSKRVRPMIEADYNVSVSASDLMNLHRKANQEKSAAELLDSKHHSMWFNADDVAAAHKDLPELTKKVNTLQTVITQTLPDTELRKRVYFDPKANVFKPATPPPRWMQLPQTDTGTNGADRTSGNPRSMTAPIDTSRPIIKNNDGSFSTERTITVESDGKHYLIPTIVDGKQLSQSDAIKSWRSGSNNPVGVFNNEADANAYAVKRSSEIGKVRSGEPTVKMRTRDGNIWDVKKSQVNDALDRNATLVDQTPGIPSRPAQSSVQMPEGIRPPSSFSRPSGVSGKRNRSREELDAMNAKERQARIDELTVALRRGVATSRGSGGFGTQAEYETAYNELQQLLGGK